MVGFETPEQGDQLMGSKIKKGTTEFGTYVDKPGITPRTARYKCEARGCHGERPLPGWLLCRPCYKHVPIDLRRELRAASKEWVTSDESKGGERLRKAREAIVDFASRRLRAEKLKKLLAKRKGK
jgi:hypothetical protein